MQVKIDNFHGIQPRVHPSLLGAGMATRAHNCRLKNGKLVPLRKPKTVVGTRVNREGGLEMLGDAGSLHVWKMTTNTGMTAINFLAFKGMTWVVEGGIADDVRDRIFVSGDTGVSFTQSDGTVLHDTPAVYFHDRDGNSIDRVSLVKDALTGIQAELYQGESVDESKTVFYVAFFASWYDANGYESGLSAASEIIEINDGSKVTITTSGIPASAAGIRIYITRNGTTDTSAGIQFLEDVELLLNHGETNESVINVRLENTGELEPGIEPIPGDMRGMVYVPGGYYAGFASSLPKTVMFSDIGTVTSWPIAYRYDVKDNIVNLVATSNSVYVLTDGYPWVLTGTAPDTMTITKLAGPAACVSARSACVYRNGVYFASHEGVMAILDGADSGTVCTNITDKIFTKEQWQAKNPESCLMLQHDGALHLFFRQEDGAFGGGLILDLSESVDAVTTHEEIIRCGCVDATTDTMYYVREN